MQQSKLIRLPGATDSLSSPSLWAAPGTGLSWAISAHKTSRKLNLLPSLSTKKKKSKVSCQFSKALPNFTQIRHCTSMHHPQGRQEIQIESKCAVENRKLSRIKEAVSHTTLVLTQICNTSKMPRSSDGTGACCILHHAKRKKISEKNDSIIYIHTSIPKHRHPDITLLVISPSAEKSSLIHNKL